MIRMTEANIKLLSTLLTECTRLVCDALYPDRPFCYNAAMVLREVLRNAGLPQANMREVSVFKDGTILCDYHFVVEIAGFLCDPTAFQFPGAEPYAVIEDGFSETNLQFAYVRTTDGVVVKDAWDDWDFDGFCGDGRCCVNDGVLKQESLDALRQACADAAAPIMAEAQTAVAGK